MPQLLPSGFTGATGSPRRTAHRGFSDTRLPFGPRFVSGLPLSSPFISNPAMISTPYIRYGGNFLLRQPYAIGGVMGCGFGVDGDLEKMQALCDKTLNLSGDTCYRVISKTVFITFFRMNHLASTIPVDAAKGFFGETELNVTLLLAAGKMIGPIFVPHRLVWHMPYLWLDSSEAMIAGRDVYGFPKKYGKVTMPLAEGQPAVFNVAAEVLPNFSPQTQASVNTNPLLKRWNPRRRSS
jgi:hypothetical protein